MLPLR